MLPLGKLRKNSVGAWEAGLFNATPEEITDEYTRFSKTEQYTLMNLWAIFRSPLMMGGYLPENDGFTLSLLTNEKLIGINQHSTGNRCLRLDDHESVWIAEGPEGTIYLALFNLSESDREIAVSLDELGLKGTHLFTQIWSGAKEILKEEVRVTLAPHASVLYEARKAPPQSK